MIADHPITATSYCLHGTMADGTYTRAGSAASNELPLHARIRIVSRQPGPGGQRRFVIRDRIGWGTRLDLWHGSCSVARAFGRRRVMYRRGW
jgi:hypothetical protein